MASAAPARRRSRLALVVVPLLLVLFCLVQLTKLREAPWDYYTSWRQADTYSIAVNYAQHDMSPLHPQLNYDGAGDNYAQLELQIVPWLSAVAYRVLGTTSYLIPRVMFMAFYLASAVFFYLLLRHFTGVLASLFGYAMYLFMPLSLLTGHAIQPESCCIFFSVAGVYFLRRFQEEKRPLHLWLASGLTAFAIMEKTPAAFVGVLFLYVLITTLGKRCLKSPLFYGCGAVTLLPPALLMLYTSRHSVFRFVDGIAGKHILTEEIFSIFSKQTITFFGRSFTTYFGWAAILLAAAGLFSLFRKERRFLLWWTVAFFLEAVTIVATIRFSYYLIFLIPIFAMLAALTVEDLLPHRKALTAGICAAALLATGLAAKSHWWLADTEPSIQKAGTFLAQHTEYGDPVAIAVIDPAYLVAAGRNGYRANIRYYDHIPQGPEAETAWFAAQGVRWFAVVDGAVYDDPDGSYLDYLNTHYALYAQGENCLLYDLTTEVSP